MRHINNINQLPFASALRAHNEQAVFAQQVWEAIAPNALLSLTHAITIREEKLIVATTHSAVAAKVKLLTPNILTRLSKLNLNVTAIQVKVQVKSEMPVNSAVRRKISKNAANHLQAASEALEPGPLADSLAKLAKHSNRG